MDKLFQDVIDALDAELERQENVLAVCRAQQSALLAQDSELVEAKNEALQLIIRETVEAEAARNDSVRALVETLGLPVDHQTMTGLIGVAPEPWATRLREVQVRLQSTLVETRRAVRNNARIARRSLRVVNQCLDTVYQVQSTVDGYDGKGETAAELRETPSLIDQKG
jgi:hypothetical protein